LRRALAVAPVRGRLYQVTSEIHYNLGQMAEVRGDRAAAQEHLEKAESEARAGLDADPDSPWCHVNLGATLVRQSRMQAVPDMNRIREAIAHFDQVLATKPGTKVEREAYRAALMNQCDALIETRDLSRALQSCEEVTRLVPDEPTSFYNLAGVYALANRPDDALRALEKDVALGDKDHAYLAADPWFATLRGDPRLEALLKRMRAATGS
jgi:tetratricopeptide (TPR) repeat protein